MEETGNEDWNYGVRIKTHEGKWRPLITGIARSDAYKFYEVRGKWDARGEKYWLAVFEGNRKITQNWYD